MRKTTALKRISEMRGRYRICQGGMRAGKTFAILQYLISIAETYDNKIISVVSNTLPALRLGAIRDFERILEETGHWLYFSNNRSTLTWTCKHTGSKIEFFSLDGKEADMKARGSARDILFVNEANRMPWQGFEQLAMRTSGFIFIDFNPTSRFWAHDQLEQREDCSLEIFTYRDNEEIPEEIKKDIESHSRDSNWWRVYGDGQIGEVEGNVFKDWEFIDEYDGDREIIGYGLDFGFNPDPCALVAFYRTDKGLMFEEIFCKTGLRSLDIVYLCKLNTDPESTIICDNARPEIIAEMKEAGIHALPCIKQERIGKELIGRMSQIMRMQECHFTAIGKNLEREYLSYSYHQNRNGDFEPVIKDGNDHLLDACRYIWFWWHRHDMINKAVEADVANY